MKISLVTIYFGMAVILVVAGVSMFRYRKKINSMDRKRLDAPPSVWQGVMVLVAMILTIGGFNEFIKLIGYLMFFVVVGISWIKKVEQK